jgi:cobyric acid synthase
VLSVRQMQPTAGAVTLRLVPDTMKVVLVAGTASAVGKHTVTCGLIRFLRDAGKRPVPFKAIAIEKFPYSASKTITPSITIQALAAGIRPRAVFNPIRVVYSSRRMTPSIRIAGISRSSPSVLKQRELVLKHISSGLKVCSQEGDLLVWEGTGAISDWLDSSLGAELIEKLCPSIILVVNALNGGALAATLGTLQLLPNPWRSRVIAVVFNNLGLRPTEQPVCAWASTIQQTHMVPLVFTLPHIPTLSLISEDRWPLASKSTMDRYIKHLSESFQPALACTTLLKHMGIHSSLNK